MALKQRHLDEDTFRKQTYIRQSVLDGVVFYNESNIYSLILVETSQHMALCPGALAVRTHLWSKMLPRPETVESD